MHPGAEGRAAYPDEFRASCVAIAREIVDGSRAPFAGASAIWLLVAERGEGYNDPLRIFVGLASEWQDSAADVRLAIEDDIREEARNLLAAHGTPPS